MFFSKSMKLIIDDKRLLKRIQRSEILFYLSIPFFTIFIVACLFMLLFYQQSQDWYPYTHDYKAVSVYAHGEVFTDVHGQGKPKITESFADYGLDYRNFKEQERLIFFQYKDDKFDIQNVYTVEEFKRLNREAESTSSFQLKILLFLSVVSLLVFIPLVSWDFLKALRWVRSGSDDIEDLYRKFRKK